MLENLFHHSESWKAASIAVPLEARENSSLHSFAERMWRLHRGLAGLMFGSGQVKVSSGPDISFMDK